MGKLFPKSFYHEAMESKLLICDSLLGGVQFGDLRIYHSFTMKPGLYDVQYASYEFNPIDGLDASEVIRLIRSHGKQQPRLKSTYRGRSIYLTTHEQVLLQAAYAADNKLRDCYHCIILLYKIIQGDQPKEYWPKNMEGILLDHEKHSISWCA